MQLQKKVTLCQFGGCATGAHYHVELEQSHAPFCVLCGEEDVIMSGVDAFVYGVPTERFCYDCGRVIHDEIIEPIRAFYKVEEPTPQGRTSA